MLCVPHNDPTWTRVSSYDEVRRELLEEIAHFFEVYKDLEKGKHVEIGNWGSREEAHAIYVAGRERHEAAMDRGHAGALEREPSPSGGPYASRKNSIPYRGAASA